MAGRSVIRLVINQSVDQSINQESTNQKLGELGVEGFHAEAGKRRHHLVFVTSRNLSVNTWVIVLQLCALTGGKMVILEKTKKVGGNCPDFKVGVFVYDHIPCLFVLDFIVVVLSVDGLNSLVCGHEHCSSFLCTLAIR